MRTRPDSRARRVAAPVAAALAASLFFSVSLIPQARDGQKSRKPASKSDIIGLLEAGVSSQEVEGVVKQYGVSFDLTRQTETELRQAGATDDLLRAIRAARPSGPSTPPARPPASSPATSPSPPVLIIESTPGGAQVYIDDEPIGTTSPEGRLKLSRLTPGEHRVRLSLQGRRDSEQTIQLPTGQTTTVTAALEEAKVEVPPAPKPEPPPATPSSVPPGPARPAEPAPSPQLLTFTVAHDHGAGGVQPNYCVGVLAIGGGYVRYRSTNGVHAFDFPLSEVKEAKKNSVYLAAFGAFHIRMKKGPPYNFVVVNNLGQYQSPEPVLEALRQAIGQ